VRVCVALFTADLRVHDGELRHLDGTTVHRVPHLDEAARAGLGYPPPLVGLAAAADRFREGRGG
jgi:deoxyribodipyrimidine photo-lyase